MNTYLITLGRIIGFSSMALGLAACGGGYGGGAAATATGYTIGGNVAGLSGTGLVLQDNGGDDKAVAANGAFAFSTPLSYGATYSVTVKTQPSLPTQTCTVMGGSGTVGYANITSVAVTCV